MSNSMNILRAVSDLHEDNMANLIGAFLYVFNALASEMNEVQYVPTVDTFFLVCFSIVSTASVV